MMKLFSFVLLTFVLSVAPFTTYAFRYTDDAEIPSWGHETVDFLRDEGIMRGFGDGSFRPHQVLNRAEALVLIFRAKGMEIPDYDINTRFTDVPKNAWFTGAVALALEEGWITGFPDGTFRPGKSLNKVEWAQLLKKAFGMEKGESTTFQDVARDTWFYDAVSALEKNNLIRVPAITQFRPDEKVSRVEAAWMISKIRNMPRLMGTSKETEFDLGQKRDSRRVAIRPKDFNAHKQGYDIEKKEVRFEVRPEASIGTINPDSGWVEMGMLDVKNSLDDRAELNSIELKLRFDSTSAGPASEFDVQLRGTGLYVEKSFDNSGRAFIAGKKILLQSGELRPIKVFLRPKPEGNFYPRAGTARLTFSDGDAITIGTLTKLGSVGRAAYRPAPIGFGVREFPEFEWTRVIDSE